MQFGVLRLAVTLLVATCYENTIHWYRAIISSSIVTENYLCTYSCGKVAYYARLNPK